MVAISIAFHGILLTANLGGLDVAVLELRPPFSFLVER
jgi:hypothetical protein